MTGSNPVIMANSRSLQICFYYMVFDTNFKNKFFENLINKKFKNFFVKNDYSH